MKDSLSPDIILCDWLCFKAPTHLTNCEKYLWLKGGFSALNNFPKISMNKIFGWRFFFSELNRFWFWIVCTAEGVEGGGGTAQSATVRTICLLSVINSASGRKPLTLAVCVSSSFPPTPESKNSVRGKRCRGQLDTGQRRAWKPQVRFQGT